LPFSTPHATAVDARRTKWPALDGHAVGPHHRRQARDPRCRMRDDPGQARTYPGVSVPKLEPRHMSPFQPADATLARDYPKTIRFAYRAAVRRSLPSERHQQLLRLGEVSLGYLASLAFADYRRSRADDPDRAVEEFIAANRRFTLGQFL